MSSVLRQRLSGFLLVVYLLTTFGLQAIHTHSLGTGNGDGTELRSHDCGTHERHLPAGFDLDCAVCHRALHFLPISVSPAEVGLEIAGFTLHQSRYLPCSEFRGAHFYRRGPPALS